MDYVHGASRVFTLVIYSLEQAESGRLILLVGFHCYVILGCTVCRSTVSRHTRVHSCEMDESPSMRDGWAVLQPTLTAQPSRSNTAVLLFLRESRWQARQRQMAAQQMQLQLKQVQQQKQLHQPFNKTKRTEPRGSEEQQNQ